MKKKAKSAKPSQTSAEVVAFLATLEHPLKPVLQAIRKIILGLRPDVREELKWNAPSFCTHEHFATFHLRAADKVQLILHRGAKVKKAASKLPLADPSGLLKWLGKDRALVIFTDVASVKSNRKAFETILREWLARL